MSRDVEDEEGHRGIVEVYVLSNEYSWKCKSSELVGLGGQPQDIAPHIQAPAMLERLRTKHALIAVGAASFEGTDRATQELLATSRSLTTVAWLRRYMSGELPPIYTLNLGQHLENGRRQKPCSDLSERERPLVILGVIFDEPGFSVSGALKKAFDEPDFPLHRVDYSQFEIARNG